MATTIEAAAVVAGRRYGRNRIRPLADEAIRASVKRAGLSTSDIDLLINTGLYRERDLGEPAMAALVQQDVGANPEDPHAGGHGTFSFDVANGTCGPLTALQIADGFLRAGTIKHAVIVAGDTRPGRRAAGFPFTAGGGAAVCRWSDGDTGLSAFRWENAPADDDLLRADVTFERGRNRLRVEQDPRFGERAAELAAKAAHSLLADLDTRVAEVDLVVPSPLTPAFLTALPARLGMPPERLVRPPKASGYHTAALLVALAAADATGRLREARRVLLLSASAGISAGAVLLTRGPTAPVRGSSAPIRRQRRG